MARQLILNSMKKFLAVLFLGLLFSNVSFGGDITEELKELNKLYQEGILTEEEFSAAKSKVIGTEKQSEKKQETKKEPKKEKKVTESIDGSLPKCPGTKRDTKTWKNCNGAYQAKDGHRYSGDFGPNGEYEGYGLLIWKGDKYEGQFHKNKKHGFGKMIHGKEALGLTAGMIYEGEWFMGKVQGQGTATWPDGLVYVGMWKDSTPNGPGTSTFKSGRKFTGVYKDGMKQGEGTLIMADGSKYVGEWKDDSANGQGTMTWANGKIEKGIWENNRLIKPN